MEIKIPTPKVHCRIWEKLLNIFTCFFPYYNLYSMFYCKFFERSPLFFSWFIYFNLVIFWFSCYSHQLFLFFIPGTFKDSDLGYLYFFCYVLSFRKWSLFTAFTITSLLMRPNSSPAPVVFPFLNLSFKCLPHYIHFLHYTYDL